MKIEQRKWTKTKGWEVLSNNNIGETAQIVFAFGGRDVIKTPVHLETLKTAYPHARILLCSTAGEIITTEVLDDSIAVTAIQFEKTALQFAQTTVTDPSQSEQAGKTLAEQLPKEQLIHALVFAEGNKMNGSGLVKGLMTILPSNVSVTGGLVGDGANFKETVVGLDTLPISGNTVLIGLYGTSLKIGYGSLGGWDPFGPDRLITKSDGHILYELDGKNALSIYKEYLGEKAKELPGSGLLFPLSLKLSTEKGTVEVVRTLLSVDEDKQSMTFAGDMPEGVSAKLMKANFERLIDGAGGAAMKSTESLGGGKTELALLISCIGRKLVLGARIEEEVEAVQNVVGQQATITGFYSYGEICPTAATEKQCQLHNQTMTITTFREE